MENLDLRDLEFLLDVVTGLPSPPQFSYSSSSSSLKVTWSSFDFESSAAVHFDWIFKRLLIQFLYPTLIIIYR